MMQKYSVKTFQQSKFLVWDELPDGVVKALTEALRPKASSEEKEISSSKISA